MTKLSDLELIILTRAAQREDHGIAAIGAEPDARSALTKLLKAKLLSTAPKTVDLAEWDRGKDGAPRALVITPAGLEAIGVETGAPKTKPTAKSSAPAKSKKAGEAVVSPKAVGRSRKPAGSAPTADVSVRAGTKLGSVIALLKRPKGATLAELMKATSWQAHSVRGAISGALKKKLKLNVTSDREGDVRRYRIAV